MKFGGIDSWLNRTNVKVFPKDKLFQLDIITVDGEDIVDGFEPMIKTTGPKLGDKNRAVGLKLQQCVHVSS
jgi:hypothetical protein